MKANWTPNDISDLSGKVAIVTGANIGLGLEISRQLAFHGATVILACRTPSKAEKAKTEELSKTLSDEQLSRVEILQLDVSSLESVHSFADEFKLKYERLDILMCNAGVMALEERKLSADNYEMQFATNHLGHFLLTGLLLPVLKSTPGTSRVVTQSSSANWSGKFDFDDLNCEKKYSRWDQYSMTKLANVVFANEFNKRCDDDGVVAFSVHPGLIIGQLQAVQSNGSLVYGTLFKIFGLFAGTYESGAVPALYACAAEDDEVTVGEFYGPDGFFNGALRGNHPKALIPNKLANDEDVMKKLWDVSEEMTRFKYEW